MVKNSPTVLSRFWTKVHRFFWATRFLFLFSFSPYFLFLCRALSARLSWPSRVRVNLPYRIVNLGGIYGSPCRLTSFSPMVDIMFRCRDVRSKFKVGPKSVFAPARGGKCPGEFVPNFSNSSHKWMCPSLVEIRSVTSEIRPRKKEVRKQQGQP